MKVKIPTSSTIFCPKNLLFTFIFVSLHWNSKIRKLSHSANSHQHVRPTDTERYIFHVLRRSGSIEFDALPMLKSAHGMALSPLFKHPELVGDTGRPFDETFSKTMRKMFAQFAKTGNPSISADMSPDGKAKEWPLYDLKEKKVMVFDEFNIHPEKESQRKIIDWDRTYFLTKYYGF
jgi:carboxylesterase type B